MQRLKALLISITVLLLIAGCSNNIARNVHSPVNGNATLQQIEDAIMAAGRANLWEMKKLRNGLIIGKLVTSDSVADIRIPYTETYYFIEYIGSRNLKRNGDKIPSGYNRWVANLNKDIQLRLLSESAR